MLVLRNPGPRESEQRREHDRDPEQPVRRAGRPMPSGSAKWKTTSVERTKRSIAGRVSRAPELDPQVLARQRDDVGEVRHASASSCRGQRSEARRARGSRRRRSLAGQRLELAIEQRRSSLVRARVRLVEHEQLGVVEQRPAERRAAASSRGSSVETRSLRASHRREALEKHADPLASLRHAVEAAEEVEVLEQR